eukprot:CAMPEP_0196660198 /NCGR_PEP_ID=MMETSP1086-20130531/38627_1 /TAXON_ID=77921 /ORGANISM="Cyanoptyche  gloeocystis , Strain SAG4.97" /LENGTH=73 /DNA_ID=CAMNT_0041994497 /DNA_START=61 /DNA_END=279 /DNA_ORIENTATION=+
MGWNDPSSAAFCVQSQSITAGPLWGWVVGGPGSPLAARVVSWAWKDEHTEQPLIDQRAPPPWAMGDGWAWITD